MSIFVCCLSMYSKETPLEKFEHVKANRPRISCIRENPDRNNASFYPKSSTYL